jgi:hypothetical protein
MRFLRPWLKEPPAAQTLESGVLNLEIFVQVQPDLVILKAGDLAASRDKSRLSGSFS